MALVLVAAILLIMGRDVGERTVLLSFDTEPVDGETPLEIVEVLNAYGVEATFFVTGEYAHTYPEIVKSLAQDHEIGCHTYSHKKLTTLSKKEKREEIVRCKETVSEVVGGEIKGFRAPWHRIDLESMMILEEEGFDYDASPIRSWGLFYPSVSGLGEVRVSSFLLVPLEDTIWIYYMRLPGLFFSVLSNKRTGLESYVFHPHQIIKEKERFEEFISDLKRENVNFISHSRLVGKHEGG